MKILKSDVIVLASVQDTYPSVGHRYSSSTGSTCFATRHWNDPL